MTVYLGFSQIPIAIGWTIEGKVAPMLYGTFSSEDLFAREMAASADTLTAQITDVTAISNDRGETRLLMYVGDLAAIRNERASGNGICRSSEASRAQRCR